MAKLPSAVIWAGIANAVTSLIDVYVLANSLSKAIMLAVDSSTDVFQFSFGVFKSFNLALVSVIALLKLSIGLSGFFAAAVMAERVDNASIFKSVNKSITS